MNETPAFWWKQRGLVACLLAPFSVVYGWAAGRRMMMKPASIARVPVLCVGNLIAGGAGKTPTVLRLAIAAKRKGLRPGILTRGFGGKITSPTIVEPGQHNSRDVGDEAMLLASSYPTCVSPDRPRGAKLLIQQGVNFIIMDDGFQNPSLHKDYCLVVVDAKRGIGNGFAMPSGPMRAGLGTQLSRADAVLLIGSTDGANPVVRAAARRAMPIFSATIKALKPRHWKGMRVLAFAGIGDPDKLYLSLKQCQAEVVETSSFGDHHHLTTEEAGQLMQIAMRDKLTIVTTSKDAARLKGTGRIQDELHARLEVFEIKLQFENERIVATIIDDTLRRAKKSRPVAV